MAEYLSLSNRLYLPRKLRFSETFIQDLNALSRAIVNEVIQRISKDPRQVIVQQKIYLYYKTVNCILHLPMVIITMRTKRKKKYNVSF